MGKYALKQLANMAMQNFIRGIRSFKVFGSVDVQIVHQHDNEHSVVIFDPVAKIHCEVLRIMDGPQPYYL